MFLWNASCFVRAWKQRRSTKWIRRTGKKRVAKSAKELPRRNKNIKTTTTATNICCCLHTTTTATNDIHLSVPSPKAATGVNHLPVSSPNGETSLPRLIYVSKLPEESPKNPRQCSVSPSWSGWWMQISLSPSAARSKCPVNPSEERPGGGLGYTKTP